MQVRDDALPLLKSMRVDYLRVARGDLRAVAALRPEQAELVSAAQFALPASRRRPPPAVCVCVHSGAATAQRDGGR